MAEAFHALLPASVTLKPKSLHDPSSLHWPPGFLLPLDGTSPGVPSLVRSNSCQFTESLVQCNNVCVESVVAKVNPGFLVMAHVTARGRE